MILTQGKYKGKDVTTVPTEWLEWAAVNMTTLPSAEAARNAVDAFPLDRDLDQTIVVAYNPRKYLSNAARDFIEEAQEILQEE